MNGKNTADMVSTLHIMNYFLYYPVGLRTVIGNSTTSSKKMRLPFRAASPCTRN